MSSGRRRLLVTFGKVVSVEKGSVKPVRPPIVERFPKADARPKVLVIESNARILKGIEHALEKSCDLAQKGKAVHGIRDARNMLEETAVELDAVIIGTSAPDGIASMIEKYQPQAKLIKLVDSGENSSNLREKTPYDLILEFRTGPEELKNTIKRLFPKHAKR